MGAATASAIMARRVVEGIVREQGYKEGTLFKALAQMRDDHKLDPRLYEWADSVRLVGNEGAHATSRSVSRDDAQEALFFAEALVDYLYVFQQRHQAFVDRRRALAEGRPVGPVPLKPFPPPPLETDDAPSESPTSD